MVIEAIGALRAPGSPDPVCRCTLMRNGNLYRNGNTIFMHLQGYGFLGPDVDVCFATRGLQRHCNEKSALVARWGPRAAASLSRTLQELAAVDHLGDMAALPHVRVSGDPSGPMVVGTSDGSRITIEAGEDGTSPASALDEIREVVVVGVAVSRTHEDESGRSRG
jgi:hypothetical protein